MRHFHWTDSDSVFVPEIDSEHRAIFEATGALEQALNDHAPAFEVEALLHLLIACTGDHLAHEENLMFRSGYASFAWHKRQHDTLRKRMRRYAPLIERGDAEAGTALVEFLTHWLTDHTGVTDRMMGAHLRNRSRTAPRAPRRAVLALGS
jgi:hemerythrin